MYTATLHTSSRTHAHHEPSNIQLNKISVKPVLQLVVSLESESGYNVHGLQLLEQQLAGVGDLDGGYRRRRLAVVTPTGRREQHR